MFDVMNAIGGRLQALLEADGGELFPAPGDRVTAIPALYYRNREPRQRNIQNPECTPSVLIYRDNGTVGFAPKTGRIVCLWELYSPYDDGVPGIEVFKRGEELLDRADDLMVRVLEQGRAIGAWDLVGDWDVAWGKKGAHPDNYSISEYSIIAKKTRG